MLRNYWYIACAASQLQSDPRAARVLDQDLVIFIEYPHAILCPTIIIIPPQNNDVPGCTEG